MSRIVRDPSGLPLAPSLSTTARFDPTSIPVWVVSDGGVYSEWLSRSTAEAREAAGVATSLRRRPDRDTALAAVTDVNAPLRQAYVDVMSALTMWKTVTAEQLAAFTGRPSITNRSNAVMDTLWDADLVIRGRHPPGSEVPVFYRRASGDAFGEFLGRLTYAERLAAFGGIKADWQRHYERHDIVTAELALRIAEHCPVTGVLGEPVASATHVFGPDITIHQGKTADMLVLRRDGLVILVETTASFPSRSAQIQKVAKWLDLMAADRTRSTALVFVAIGEAKRGNDAGIASQLRGLVPDALWGHFEAQRMGIADRVAVVAWRDWFPEPGQVSPGFLALRAQRPRLGVSPDDTVWEDVDLLDPFAVTSDVDLSAAKARHRFVRWYRPTPYWLRSRTESYDWKTPILVDSFGQEVSEQLIGRFRRYDTAT